MFDEKHEERKKVITDYLMGKQYLKKSAQFVLDEAPNMWKLLDEKELIPAGMTYDDFLNSIQIGYATAQTKAMMGEL